MFCFTSICTHVVKTLPLQGVSVIQHWAVKVGDTWLEIERGAHLEAENVVTKTTGEVAPSGACYYGGESVGWTSRTWEEIDQFTSDWINKHPDYLVFADNCRGFSTDLVHWLTESDTLPFQIITPVKRQKAVKLGRSQSLNRKLRPVEEVEEQARRFTAPGVTRSQTVNDGQAVAAAHVFKVRHGRRSHCGREKKGGGRRWEEGSMKAGGRRWEEGSMKAGGRRWEGNRKRMN